MCERVKKNYKKTFRIANTLKHKKHNENECYPGVERSLNSKLVMGLLKRLEHPWTSPDCNDNNLN